MARRGRNAGPGGSRRQRIKQRKEASSPRRSNTPRRESAPRSRVPSTNVRSGPPAVRSVPSTSVSTRATPRPYSTVTVNADPRLTGPGTGRAALPPPGPMKDVTPRRVAPRSQASRGSSRPALGGPAVPSGAFGRVLGRAAGAVGLALTPTPVADATVERGSRNARGSTPATNTTSSASTGGPARYSPPKKKPAAQSAPAAPSLSNSDVLNRLSARGVSQSTMRQAGPGGSSDAMKKLRELERSTRGIKGNGLKPRKRRMF